MRHRKKADTGTTYEVEWRFVHRIASEHLGARKYAASTTALGELVANALDADARLVDIEVRENKIGGIDSLVVTDTGCGMTGDDIRERFTLVGVEPSSRQGAKRLGRFGVGRLAVHRLGSVSNWVTVAKQPDGRVVESGFTLRSSENSKLRVAEREVAATMATGTRIEVFNLTDADSEALTPARIASDLMVQFCSYLLAHRDRSIRVQGELLDVAKLVIQREGETLADVPRVTAPARIEHLILSRPLGKSRIEGQILFSAKGQTVKAIQPEDPPAPTYVAIVECAYLDNIVMANRESIIDMDPGFMALQAEALNRVSAFGERLRASRRMTFLQRAREEPYYPYREPSSDPVAGAKRAIYDVVLERINEHANVEAMTKKQQAVMFKLLDRSLNNENLLEILHEVAKLSDQDMERFRKVLERTTLDSIIRLSSEVTTRLEYLEVLHKLVYGEISATVKERSQLHKFLEPHCWLFGPTYHLATSDKSFREVIRQHRLKAGLEPAPEQAMKDAAGIDDIPDLFLAAVREYPTNPGHHHLLVELKAPSVTLGRKELEQIKRYADTILDSPQFDKQTTYWDLFLVSSKVSESVERDRHQKDKPAGCLWEWENMKVWAFSWGEVISKARDEMRLVRDHLQQKSKELSLSDYLRDNFPEVLGSMEAAQAKKDASAEVEPTA